MFEMVVYKWDPLLLADGSSCWGCGLPPSSGVRLSISLFQPFIFVFLRCIHVQCPPPPVGSQGWVVELTGFSPGIPAQGTLYKVLSRRGRWLLGFRTLELSWVLNSWLRVWACSWLLGIDWFVWYFLRRASGVDSLFAWRYCVQSKIKRRSAIYMVMLQCIYSLHNKLLRFLIRLSNCGIWRALEVYTHPSLTLIFVYMEEYQLFFIPSLW